jgi:hypothetical protein
MASQTPDINIYPSITFRDPYLHPIFLKTNDSNSIYQQVFGDWMLDAFINQLDNEICDDITQNQEAHALVKNILDYTRIFGYCVVCSYEYDGVRVYSELERTDWIKYLNPITNRTERLGIKVNWTDDLGNSYNDDVFFSDVDDGILEYLKIKNPTFGYLFKYADGNGKILPNSISSSAFARGELSVAVLGSAIQVRQTMASLSFESQNPYFYHVRYGESITPKQSSEIMNKMAYVNITRGIGAKTSVIEDIDAKATNAVDTTLKGLDQLIRNFTSVTRLPLSFYTGERKNGGLGDTGEKDDNFRILIRKKEILSHFKDNINFVLSELGYENIDEEFYNTQQNDLEEKYNAQQKNMNIGDDKNKQKIEGVA